MTHKIDCSPYTRTKIVAIKHNDSWFTPSTGEFLRKDKSGYYVLEKVGLHPIHGSTSVIKRVWSEKNIEDVLIYEN